ncbi:Elongation of very long chain fatty acids protein AAEL008004 [Gryllus bimaculatus]|nr:Elongation of very long chain fatty acids protein AAEL008004 [Gryllus bimaculatus]
MALFRQLLDDFHDLMDRNGDPRTKDWPLMSSPFPTAAICLSYVYLVKVLGPRIMENRKPLELKNVLVFYNLFQSRRRVLRWPTEFHSTGDVTVAKRTLSLNSAFARGSSAFGISMSGWVTGHYNFRCQPVDYSNHPKTLRFFFILRKKNSHVSTLHVIHHGIMPMSVWFGVKFTPGGHSTFFGLVNTFVHIVMYTYYLLSAMGPQYQKYLWWKKYLTTFQMVQFVAIMVHAFQLLFIDCNYPRAFVWWIGLHAVMFYFLFSDFYKQAYTKSVSKQKGVKGTNEKLIDATQRKIESQSQTKEYSKPQAADYYINAVTGLHLRQVTREMNENGLQ